MDSVGWIFSDENDTENEFLELLQVREQMAHDSKVLETILTFKTLKSGSEHVISRAKPLRKDVEEREGPSFRLPSKFGL